MTPSSKPSDPKSDAQILPSELTVLHAACGNGSTFTHPIAGNGRGAENRGRSTGRWPGSLLRHPSVDPLRIARTYRATSGSKRYTKRVRESASVMLWPGSGLFERNNKPPNAHRSAPKPDDSNPRARRVSPLGLWRAKSWRLSRLFGRTIAGVVRRLDLRTGRAHLQTRFWRGRLGSADRACAGSGTGNSFRARGPGASHRLRPR